MIQNIQKLYTKYAGYFKFAGILAIMVITGIFYMASGKSSKSDGEKIALDIGTQQATEIVDNSSGMQESVSEILPESTTDAIKIYVHICGCVCNPGVYAMSEGTRVYQAVELAGGMTEEANQSYLNMAEGVTDGQKVYIPSMSEQSPESGNNAMIGRQETSSGKININTAEKEQLMTLPGIGESKANDIITYRQNNGKFNAIEDIMNISGIKESAFGKIKDLITVK